MSRDINPFGLRMPPDLREKLEDACRQSGRSMNAEIVKRLRESLGTIFPLHAGEAVHDEVLPSAEDRAMLGIVMLHYVRGQLDRVIGTLEESCAELTGMQPLRTASGEPITPEAAADREASARAPGQARRTDGGTSVRAGQIAEKTETGTSPRDSAKRAGKPESAAAKKKSPR